jgi:uncharacterized membrane protein (DUF106 family)
MNTMSIENVQELIDRIQAQIGQAMQANDLSEVDQLNEELSDLEDELFKARMRETGEWD